MTVGIKPDVAFAAQTVHRRWMSEEYERGLVSVIIPTYNRAHLVTKAMDSVWQQTYRPIELIVVDDGSTDNSQEVVEQWGNAHADDAHFKLRYFRQENRGASAARNFGLIESRGESIQFLDSDDLLGQMKIAAQVDYLRHEMRFDAVYGRWRSFIELSHGGFAVSLPSRQYNGDTLLTSWIEGRFIGSHAILWRRKTAVELGPWDEKAFCNNDGEYAYRFMISGRIFGWSPNGWAYNRRGGDDHLGAVVSRRSAEALFRIAERLVAELTARNMLNLQLRKSIARHYFRIARAAVGVHSEIAFECFMRIKRLGTAHPAQVMMYASGTRGAMLITKALMSVLRSWRKRRGMKPIEGKGRVGSLDELIRLDTVSSR